VSAESETPKHLLDAHPETAYFWGRVIGDGEVTADGVTVRTNDEDAAERLAAIAGADDIDHDTIEREYAHDTSITRSEDSYTVQIHGPIGDRAAAALGLPFGGDPGGYRLDTLAGFDRQLLRGLLEGSGTVCFKSSSGTVGSLLRSRRPGGAGAGSDAARYGRGGRAVRRPLGDLFRRLLVRYRRRGGPGVR